MNPNFSDRLLGKCKAKPAGRIKSSILAADDEANQ